MNLLLRNHIGLLAAKDEISSSMMAITTLAIGCWCSEFVWLRPTSVQIRAVVLFVVNKDEKNNAKVWTAQHVDEVQHKSIRVSLEGHVGHRKQHHQRCTNENGRKDSLYSTTYFFKKILCQSVYIMIVDKKNTYYPSFRRCLATFSFLFAFAFSSGLPLLFADRLLLVLCLESCDMSDLSIWSIWINNILL